MPVTTSLRWRLLQSFLVISLLPLAAVFVMTIGVFRTMHLELTQSDLVARATLFETIIHDEDTGTPESRDRMSALCRSLNEETGTRFTVIDLTGTVIADSFTDYAAMENHADRPEFIEAIDGDVGVSRRYSTTTGKNMLYVALPLKRGA